MEQISFMITIPVNFGKNWWSGIGVDFKSNFLEDMMAWTLTDHNSSL